MTDNRRPPRQEGLDGGLLRQIGLFAAGLPRTRPIYRHLCRTLAAAIANGTLKPGMRLPAERHLALLLDVSRATVVNAYRALESQGLVRGYVGRGTFVAAAPDSSGAPFAWRGKVAAAALRTSDTVMRDLVRDSSDPTLLSAGAGVPALDVFPAEAFRQCLDRVLRREARVLWGHSPTEGLPAFRESIARRFGGAAENVLVLAGAQQGLDLLARCLIDPGDTVVIDRPGYLGAIHSFRAAGARLVGWDIVRHDLDELEELLVRYRPKLIYVNPTFQNPTGWTMPIRLRRDVLALAGRLCMPVIEDDTYSELHLGAVPPPSLHSLDAQSLVIHLGTFSKMLAPGLRLGWLSAAAPIVNQLALIKQRADPHTPNLLQSVVGQLIDDGAFEEHLTRLRLEHRRRRDAMAGALQRHVPPGLLQWTIPDGGLYFWCRLPPRVNAATVLRRALDEGVTFVPGRPFYVDPAGEREFRLCFSNIPVGRAEELAKSLARSGALVQRDMGGDTPLMAIV